MSARPTAVVVIDDSSPSFGKRGRLGERYALGVLLALRSEAIVRHETVIGIRENDIAAGKSILDCFKPAPPPVPAITPPHPRDVQRLARKGGVTQHTGPLHGLDRPVVVAQEFLQSLEQLWVEVMPSLALRKLLCMAAIASRTGIVMQVPRDPETLPPLDCPQQPVLHEVTDIPGVAILHGLLLYRWGARRPRGRNQDRTAEEDSTHQHDSQGLLMSFAALGALPRRRFDDAGFPFPEGQFARERPARQV